MLRWNVWTTVTKNYRNNQTIIWRIGDETEDIIENNMYKGHIFDRMDPDKLQDLKVKENIIIMNQEGTSE
jgi:hypothetical protein